MSIPRRSFLAATAALPFALASGQVAFGAMPGENRLVFVVLRGAMDGLHAIPPLGDPDYAAARGGLAMSKGGDAAAQDAGAIQLDPIFALHPALSPVLPLWKNGQFMAVHAVATPYRDRSHFDGQDVLESGATSPHLLADGWLGRSLAALGGSRTDGLAVGLGVPLSARGPVAVSSWAPSSLKGLPPEQIDQLRRLYSNDKLFARALDEGVQSADFVDRAMSGDPQMEQHGGNFKTLAPAAGKILAADGGPRLAVMEVYGWDTHVGQGLATGRMAQALGDLASGLAAMADAVGPAWNSTLVVAASEFGRTVAMNGTNGTDHGTATAVLIAGGAARGGRVVADWPGLGRNNLFEGRDLAPTADLRAVLKGALHDHMRLSEDALATKVFPDSSAVKPMQGLVRA